MSQKAQLDIPHFFAAIAVAGIGLSMLVPFTLPMVFGIAIMIAHLD